jgi:hypothetical protein
LKSTLKYILFLGLGGALLWFSFRNQNLLLLGESLKSENYYWVALSVLVSIVAHWLRALRWKMLFEPIGYQPKTTHTFYAVMIGYLANLAFPRMGEVSRCAVLNKTDNMPIATLIGTVVVERIIDVIFLLGLGLLAILILYKEINVFVYNNFIAPLITILNSAVGLIIPAIVISLVLVVLFFLIRKKINAWHITQKIKAFTLSLKKGFLSVLQLKNRLRFFGLSVGIWTCYLLATYLCFFAIPATSQLNLAIGLFVMVAGGIGMSAPVQGGIGAFEAAVSISLLVFGIQENDGLSYAAISHGSQILSILVVGSISLFFVFLIKRKQA